VTYEPRFERFDARGPDGRSRSVEFKKAGFLAAGDQPEVFFFHVDAGQVIVGVSGEALRQLQGRRRHLSREEKIDIAGLFLKERIEAGKELVAANLSVGGRELERLVSILGLFA